MNGIIVGADITQEWILPWWWEHYSKHNSLPVAFIDLGMSFEMKDWCKARGDLIRLRLLDFAAEKEEVDPMIAQKFEAEFGNQFWDYRNAWFKKPFACLLSPFQQTIWIDVDCEIRGSVTPLFEYAGGINPAMAREQVDLSRSYKAYNSGIIAFRHNHSLLREWADACLTLNSNFRGDDDLFAYIVSEKGIEIDEIPPEYNWSRCSDDNPQALILHWHGAIGKRVIRNQMQLK